MLLSLLAVVVGLAILVYSADVFIDGAVAVATKYHMPKMLIGALIIGVGTSAPELVVSALSALSGSPGLALGNAYGSNIVNIMLVLGLTLLISPITIQKQVVKSDFLWLIVVTILSVFLLLDGHLGRLDALILIAAMLVNITAQIMSARKSKQSLTEQAQNGGELLNPNNIKIGQSLLKLVAGLVILILSSRLIVWGAVELAKLWGLPDLIIGLTIVAIGTSLPELVSSIIAARRGEFEMALGNVLGSNLFNTLAVVGLAAIIAPMQVSAEIISRDVVVMCAITTALFLLCLNALRTNGKIGRLAGAFLVLCFIGYSSWLAVSALGISYTT